ncbi:radial spoke head protein 6 homolog A [Lates japonicus]|uniref:Radial spoke head protein 6 homolog A n=1 Tax=Lates japonicus TaxID=270547 RepID=A0AAD3NJR6_LATJO|nr:radial spoke head protein 6 homolog A [Lates japonicus]
MENIYVGWGLKYAGKGTAHLSPTTMAEYPSGLEITELLDPSLEEEQALRKKLGRAASCPEENEDTDEEE